MPNYVALIRGIGPGDPNKTNEKLRGTLESLGFSQVESVISSGNIIFHSDIIDTRKLESMIEAAWPELLGFKATTIVRSETQLENLLTVDYFKDLTHSEKSYLLVTILKHPQEPDFDMPYQPQGKTYVIAGYKNGAVFSITDNTQVKTTDLMVWLEKRFSKNITSRTPLTIERILKRMKQHKQ